MRRAVLATIASLILTTGCSSGSDSPDDLLARTDARAETRSAADITDLFFPPEIMADATAPHDARQDGRQAPEVTAGEVDAPPDLMPHDGALPCASGSLLVEQVNLAGTGGNTAEVKPNKTVTLAFDWTLAAPPDCLDCNLQIIIALDGTPTSCFGAGIVSSCPDGESGNYLGTIVAPTEPGNYVLSVAASASSACLDLDQLELVEATETELGTLTVTELVAANAYSQTTLYWNK